VLHTEPLLSLRHGSGVDLKIAHSNELGHKHPEFMCVRQEAAAIGVRVTGAISSKAFLLLHYKENSVCKLL
jgi:hypothetical protein